MNFQLKSAWVITREGPRHRTEVIGVLSAKIGSNRIKERVEWLYALLHSGIEFHIDSANYQKPGTPCEAYFMPSESGITTDYQIHCGGHKYLRARLAKNVGIIDPDATIPVLRWTEPDLPVFDREALRIVKKRPGPERQAIVHLPLSIPTNEIDITTC